MDVDTELRCYCSTKPLLAKVGRDPKTREPVIHIKSWKGGRLYVEALVLSGVVKLKCRACGRWHRVKIVHGAPTLQEQKTDPLAES